MNTSNPNSSEPKPNVDPTHRPTADVDAYKCPNCEEYAFKRCSVDSKYMICLHCKNIERVPVK